MNKPLDPTLTLLVPTARVRLVKNSLTIEQTKPNFIFRFIRWIKGEYNKAMICDKIHDIAILCLQNPQMDAQKLRTLKTNYALLINRAQAEKFCIRRFHTTIHTKTLENIQKAIDAFNIVPKPMIPANPPAPVKKPVLKPLNINKQQVRLRPVHKISPLEVSWKSTVGEVADWKKQPLNTLKMLPFAAKLETAESLFNWICEGMEEKPAFHLAPGKSEAETLQLLMEILGMATPQSCIDQGVDPTEESITKRICDSRSTWIALATSLGCIKVDEEKLKEEWMKACEEESYDVIQNESVALYARVEFLQQIMNADMLLALVFGDKKPLVSWNDPQVKFKRLPEQSVFAQNQLKLLDLETIDAFVKKQILPTLDSLKNYLKAHESECQKLVMEYLERQNYVRT
jgi:hypothetical protein